MKAERQNSQVKAERETIAMTELQKRSTKHQKMLEEKYL